ncbi:hypothetical protein [Sorangium atrum]|uniref:Uncharacterized protein n=1 Tax=Sorangium atrum TaxID=2995308 RepID=A0ABT5BXI6_9BACT|nr:hypothetical protein [Sorangium aterium]MDC0678254.1 hypothetical protein [Sorangium aterium]
MSSRSIEFAATTGSASKIEEGAHALLLGDTLVGELVTWYKEAFRAQICFGRFSDDSWCWLRGVRRR